MKFGNKMLKPVVCKYTVNMNENVKFDQILWAQTSSDCKIKIGKHFTKSEKLR